MKIDNTIKSYNKSAKVYEKIHLGRRTFWKKEFQIFSKLVPKGKILEIGCGPGFDSLLFKKTKYDYTGIDGSTEMIKLAKKRNSKAKFLLMDLNHLKFPRETFDGFWAVASLIHAKRKNIKKILVDIYKTLKPFAGGFIVMKSRDGGSKEETKFDKRYNASRYFAFYDLLEFKSILEQSAFKVIKAQKFSYIASTRSWMGFFIQKI